MKFLPLLLILTLAGCSSMREGRFRDRGDDYLKVEEYPETLDVNGRRVGGQDLYPMPVLATVPALPHSFEVPKPEVLPSLDEPEEEVQSLTEYQSKALNPRLETDGSGSLVLRMDGSFAYCWAAVSDALSASSLKMTDLNRSVGTWYLELSERETEEDLGWWSRLWGAKPEVVSKNYLLKMNRARTGVYLSLLEENDKLASPEQTEAVLQVLNKQLNK
jgi:outer membrane protein assembly factor BamC